MKRGCEENVRWCFKRAWGLSYWKGLINVCLHRTGSDPVRRCWFSVPSHFAYCTVFTFSHASIQFLAQDYEVCLVDLASVNPDLSEACLVFSMTPASINQLLGWRLQASTRLSDGTCKHQPSSCMTLASIIQALGWHLQASTNLSGDTIKFASVSPALSKTITDVLDETCKRQVSFSKRIPVNMPDPTRKRFDYSQRVAIIGQDRICQLPLPVFFSGLFFQTRHGQAWAILCKIDPGPIWMAWPGFGNTHLVWKQAGVQASSGAVSGRNQPARY